MSIALDVEEAVRNLETYPAFRAYRQEAIQAVIDDWRASRAALIECRKVRDRWCAEYVKLRDAKRGKRK